MLLFVIVAVQALRRPTRANIDIALFFSAPTLIIGLVVALRLGVAPPSATLARALSAGYLALPYLLLRLMDDVTVVPVRLRRVAEALFAAALATVWLLPRARPGWIDLLLLGYMIGVLTYAVATGVRATRRARGVTRRRLWAVTAGSLFLVLNIAAGSMAVWLPGLTAVWQTLAALLGLATGVAYLLGFAPPRWLRRAWQEPELRAFLSRAATLPRLPDTAAIISALEYGAASAVGAPNALIGLWDSARQTLRFTLPDRQIDIGPEHEVPAARAFRLQEPVFSPRTRYSGVDQIDLPRAAAAQAVLAAPITADVERLGVLVVYAARAPVFADDDLALVQLLANQAAVILESRKLIDEAAWVRAREETARLKEDFVSAAAHDLKTPLTTLIMQAQLIERRALRAPDEPTDLVAVRRIIQEGQRLKSLVLELLDAARVEQGRLVDVREPVDLTEVARETCARLSSARNPCTVSAEGQAVGMYDLQRVRQLIENLVENAIKYSPNGGPVRVAIRRELGKVHLVVSDCGIGIPSDDLPMLFQRFHRGKNVDDRRFPGMGLGLFICKGIVEQHGGEIVVSSRVGVGSTFHITLPLVPIEVATYAAHYSGDR